MPVPAGDDGGSDVTSVSQTRGLIEGNTTSTNTFTNNFIINNSANEKLSINHGVIQGAAGAGTAPNRWESVNKWDNTSSQITAIQIYNPVGGSAYGSGSLIKVWGHD